MELVTVILLCFMVLVASCLQGSVGIGLGMIAAPTFALLKPEYFPVTVIILAALLSSFMMFREWTAIDWSMFGWVFVGRIPGTYLGVLAVVYLPFIIVSLALSLIILLGIFSFVRGWQPRGTTFNIILAGVFSGAFGTATSVGGPPLIAVMRNFTPRSTRATLSSVFTLGSLLSLVALAIGGSFQIVHFQGALLLVPFMLVGLLFSNIIVRKIEQAFLMKLAVGTSIAGAILVFLQAVVELI